LASFEQGSKRTRVALVGAGYVAAHHIRALRSLEFIEIVGIADLRSDLAQDLARRFAIPLAGTTLDDLAPARPDVLHVLTPPSSHCALALDAMERGWHVLVEKPMAETAGDCERMIAKARETGRVLSVNHSARFDPTVLAALEEVKAGRCGDLLHVDFLRSSDYIPYAGGPLPPPYRTGSYPFQDLGVHGLYTLEAFLGPIGKLEVEFRGTGANPYLAFDEWHAVARTARGVGRMYLSWNARPMVNEFWIAGTAGQLRADCFLQVLDRMPVGGGPKFVQLVVGRVKNAIRTAFRVPLNVLRFATKRLPPSPGIYHCVREFHLALRRGDPPPVPPEEGLRMLQLIGDVSRQADEAARSRHAGRMPVSLPPARAVLTGATGFLGTALLRRLLEQGETVRCLVRSKARLPEEAQINAVEGDLGDAELVDQAISGAEVVYHVGAAMKGATEDFQRATVWGTRHVIDACLKHGVKRLVYVSSLSVLDHAGRRPETPVREDAAYEPYPERRGAYTQTKLEAERLVIEAARTKDLPAVILRPGQIFGPGSERVSPSGVIGLAGRWLVVGNGRRLLPLVHVEDVADALLAAAAADVPPGSVFHLVDPAPVTQRQYIQAVRPLQDPPIPSLTIPMPLMRLLTFGVETLGKLLKKPVPLTAYRLASLRPLHPCDISAAREKLGWNPQRTLAGGWRKP
jgi:nucleoside-diphosphate-sugar epimerase/predicted dehydrogenase